MERLTQEAQIGPFASLRDKAEAKPHAFNDYDCLLAHMRAVTALKSYEDICFDKDGKERITVEELSALIKARDEGRVRIYGESYKCPKCGAYRLTPRVDREFYFCFHCKTQFSRAEAEAAIGKEIHK